jgi:catechol-2,3-dioxygenase
MNSRVKALGETVLRVRDLQAVKRFYVDVIGLEGTSLHHFALEIDKGDFPAELDRLRSLGLDVTTVDHRWCRWRSMYVRDPEGNILELVCYDESIE